MVITQAAKCSNPNGGRANNSEGPSELLETQDLSCGWVDDEFGNTKASEIHIELGRRVTIGAYEFCSGSDDSNADPVSWYVLGVLLLVA